MQNAVEKAEQIGVLTGLKGFACFVIMLNHFSGVFFEVGSRPWERYPLATLFFNGTFMLYVFYIVSGFFVAYSVFTKKDDFGHLGKRIFGRYIRLVVPVMVVCLIVLVFQYTGLYESYDKVKNITLSFRKEQDAGSYYYVGTLAQALKTALLCPLQSTTDFSFVLWMLPIIYRGFFVSLITALLIRPVKPFPAFLLILLGSLYVSKYNEITYASFLIGVYFAYIYTNIGENLRRFRWIGMLCVILVLLFGSHWPNAAPNNLIVETILNYLPNYVPLHIIGASSLLISAVTLPPLKKLLSSRLFSFLGKISFGVYLIHDMMQIAVGANVFLICYRLSESIPISRAAAFLSSTCFTLFGAYLFWRYIDRHIGNGISGLWSAICRPQHKG